MDVIPKFEAKPPNGGLVAWLQVLGSFLMAVNSWGIVSSFGIFQSFYESHLLGSSSHSDISWIGSMQSFLLLFAGALSGPIFDRGYFLSLLWIGSSLTTLGMLMTSFCSKYWQVMLAQGMCVGLGAACVYIPCMAIIAQYFDRKKALATGLATSGGSFGGVIYPLLFRNLEPKIGFQWTVRTISLIVLVTQCISLSMMRLRVQPTEKRKLFDTSAWREWPYVYFVAGLFTTGLGIFIPIWYIQAYATQKSDISNDNASYLVTILNSGAVAGRILPNFMSDKVGSLNMITPCTIIAGILVFCWMKLSTETSTIAFAVLYGFFSAAIVSLAPVGFVSLTPQLSSIGTRMGMGFAVMGFGLLIGPPVGGQILSSHGYVALQAFGASVLIVGGICMSFARISKVGRKIRVAT